jgi:hypothetical protein
VQETLAGLPYDSYIFGILSTSFSPLLISFSLADGCWSDGPLLIEINPYGKELSDAMCFDWDRDHAILYNATTSSVVCRLKGVESEES